MAFFGSVFSLQGWLKPGFKKTEPSGFVLGFIDFLGVLSAHILPYWHFHRTAFKCNHPFNSLFVRMAANQESKEENYYYLTIDSNRMIDAGPKGNIARQVRCFFTANSIATGTLSAWFLLHVLPGSDKVVPFR